jgi:putative transposase
MTDATRTYRFRLYPTPSQAARLDLWLMRCRHLYNDMLTQRIWSWQTRRVSITYYDQQNALPEIRRAFPEYAELPSNVLQNVARRVDIAYQRFFRHGAGFPKYQGFRRYNSFCLHSPSGWKLRPGPGRMGRLSILRLGDIPVRVHRPVAGELRTCTIVRQAGRWYACITARHVPIPELPASPAAVGVDLRVAEHFLATSDGELIDNPHPLEQALRDLARIQRTVSRRQRGSNRREDAVRQLQRAHQRVANLRREFHHRLSHDLVTRYQVIVVEDISPLFMVERAQRDPYPRNQARRALDSGWGQFLGLLEYKCRDLGRMFIRVEPAMTSQTCSRCGAEHDTGPTERIFRCPQCGWEVHRAINAARNILARGLELEYHCTNSRLPADGDGGQWPPG